jgi:hypothetical protein
VEADWVEAGAGEAVRERGTQATAPKGPEADWVEVARVTAVAAAATVEAVGWAGWVEVEPADTPRLSGRAAAPKTRA